VCYRHLRRNSSQAAAIWTVSSADGERLNDLSGRIIGCAFTVLNTLGTGFLEKIYENALAHQVR
jgi:hypothetical protein